MSKKNAETLVEVSRGEVIEHTHAGHVVVIDKNRDIIFSKGDPYKYTYMRSCAKPVQVLPLLKSNGLKHFGFTLRELAIMCASHYAEPFHLDTLNSILNKTGLKESDLTCGNATSLKSSHAITLAREGKEDRPLYNDCSGKHLGMLAYSLIKKYPVLGYLEFDSRTQQDITKTFARFCEYPLEKITIGIDGCSAPVFALPLYNMALSYLKIAGSDLADREEKQHCDNIFNAMTSHPEMVAGTDGFCTDLMRLSNGKLIGKVGAEGVYCVGVKDQSISMAVKIEDGSMAVLSSIVIELLNKFNILSKEESAALEKWRKKPVLNDRQTLVGYQQPVKLA